MPYTEDDHWDYMGRRDKHSLFIAKMLIFMIAIVTLALVILFVYLIFLLMSMFK